MDDVSISDFIAPQSEAPSISSFLGAEEPHEAYHRANIEAAKERLGGVNGQSWGEYLGQRSLPHISGAATLGLAEMANKVREGMARGEQPGRGDYEILAHHELEQEREAKRSLGAKIGG